MPTAAGASSAAPDGTMRAAPSAGMGVGSGVASTASGSGGAAALGRPASAWLRPASAWLRPRRPARPPSPLPTRGRREAPAAHAPRRASRRRRVDGSRPSPGRRARSRTGGARWPPCRGTSGWARRRAAHERRCRSGTRPGCAGSPAEAFAGRPASTMAARTTTRAWRVRPGALADRLVMGRSRYPPSGPAVHRRMVLRAHGTDGWGAVWCGPVWSRPGYWIG